MSDHFHNMTESKKSRIAAGKVDDPEDDTAAAKLWTVYVSEASRYDKALVESWKGDMEGLVIFAGLFSTILTAFLIESYKTLTSNSNDVAVQILTRISLQLAALSSDTTIDVEPLPLFTPSATSVICNSFWFISLGFSLACALIATLVQQWAREFLHRADMCPAPLIRARVYSYLYYGLKGFHMHTVVEIIPFLLHASLLFFFCGLATFLIPVNFIMTFIVVAILFIVLVVYAVLSCLPLRYLDCPYRTPLSGACWLVLQGCRRLWRRLQRRRCIDPEHADSSKQNQDCIEPASKNQTMVATMFRAALTDNRWDRDHRALVWTMKSLADNRELEPFIEAIPDLLWGSDHRRHTYEDHILGLIRRPDLQLHNCIASLLDSCDTRIIGSVDSTRRRITCYRALWAIASLAKPTDSSSESSIAMNSDFTHIFEKFTLRNDDPAAPYFISADVMMLWSMYCGVRGRLIDLTKDLDPCEFEGGGGGNPESYQMPISLHDIDVKFSGMVQWFRPKPIPPGSSSRELRELAKSWLLTGPYNILFEYLSRSAASPSLSYRWDETLSVLALDPSVPFSAYQQQLEICMDRVMSRSISTKGHRLHTNYSGNSRTARIDEIMSILLSLWQPEDRVRIPRPIVKFLNRGNPESENALRASERIISNLWSNFPSTLSEGPSALQEDKLTALWNLSCLSPIAFGHDDSNYTQLEAVLSSLSTMGPSFSHLSASIIALIKWRITYALEIPRNTTAEEARALFNNRILPEASVYSIPSDILGRSPDDRISEEEWKKVHKCIQRRKIEARTIILAEFLEHCCSAVLPYKAAETFGKLIEAPHGAIHHSYQYRLANSIHKVFAAVSSPGLLAAIIDHGCWTLYAGGSRNEHDGLTYRVDLDDGEIRVWPWLDNPIARQTICESFTGYAGKLTLSAASPETLDRLRKILQGIQSWHPHDMSKPPSDVAETDETPLSGPDGSKIGAG